MTITIEVSHGSVIVYSVMNDGKLIGRWTYLDAAIEAARKEILVRFPY